MSDELESFFPGLQAGEYSITTHADPRYNCIAWAASDTSSWWWPNPFGFWPEGISRNEEMESFVDLFRKQGFEITQDQVLEEGYERVAIFTDLDGSPTHAARQLLSGRWTSKLGKLEDIEHSLEAVAGKEYGSVAVILRRRLP